MSLTGTMAGPYHPDMVALNKKMKADKKQAASVQEPTVVPTQNVNTLGGNDSQNRRSLLGEVKRKTLLGA